MSLLAICLSLLVIYLSLLSFNLSLLQNSAPFRLDDAAIPRDIAEIMAARDELGRAIEAVADAWAGRAKKSKPFVPALPLHVFVNEAFELAAFIEQHWTASAAGGLPGLEGLARDGFDESCAKEMRELALAVMHWEAREKATYVPAQPPPVERARAVLSELLAALSFVLEDTSRSNDARTRAATSALRAVRASVDTATHDAFALSLESVAELARKHQRALASLPDFDVASIREASALANELRQRSARRLTNDDPRAALRDTRARVARLLDERVSVARAAIRFAFRAHPELVARATSEYRRGRRATQRSKKRTASA